MRSMYRFVLLRIDNNGFWECKDLKVSKLFSFLLEIDVVNVSDHSPVLSTNL